MREGVGSPGGAYRVGGRGTGPGNAGQRAAYERAMRPSCSCAAQALPRQGSYPGWGLGTGTGPQ